MDDTAIMAPYPSALAEITEALAGKPFPVFLTKYGPALWPVTDETAGPPAIVLSVPRSGTYFTEALYKRMGYGGVYVHAMDQSCNDERLAPFGVRNLKVGGLVPIPVTVISRLVLPGQIIVSHCGRNAEIETALVRFRKIYLYRDLREVIVSHARSDSKQSLARGKGPISVIEFCQSRGTQLKAIVEEVAKWRDSSDVLPLDFADLTSADAARVAVVASRFAAFMGWREADVVAALGRVPGDRTITRSEGGHSKLEGMWDDECEAWFSEHMGEIDVRPTRSASLTPAATRTAAVELVVATNAGKEATSRVGSPPAAAQGEPKPAARKPAVAASELVMLPGTAYAKYALPLDYPPSRDLRPRWGNTHPPIPVLHDWFRAHAARYDAFLDEMAGSLAALDRIPQQFRAELLPEPAWFGVPFAPIDSVALYTMVRQRRPQTYIEIGSGITTCFVAKAVRDNSLRTRIVSIDPEPRAAIDGICDEVIREGLETCDLDRFAALRPNDILFFDGSHRAFTNSDVTVFMIDVLPRLQPGVIVHVHDVSLPWDYPQMFVDWYWNEQYLLAAYMIGARERLDPILPTAFICRDEAFAARLARPLIDFGDAHLNSGWRGGGSMWFAHL
jgi:predicted O-methyltransferase YrrM